MWWCDGFSPLMVCQQQWHDCSLSRLLCDMKPRAFRRHVTLIWLRWLHCVHLFFSLCVCVSLFSCEPQQCCPDLPYLLWPPPPWLQSLCWTWQCSYRSVCSRISQATLRDHLLSWSPLKNKEKPPTWVERIQQVTCGSVSVLGSYLRNWAADVCELMVTASSDLLCAVLRVGEHRGTY